MATETPAEPRLDTAGGTNYRRAGQSGAEGRAVSARDGYPRNPPLIPGCAPLFAILHPIAIVKHFLCKLHRLLLLFTGVLTTGGLHSQTPDDFNPGANSNIYPLAVQTDGRILVGGLFHHAGRVAAQPHRAAQQRSRHLQPGGKREQPDRLAARRFGRGSRTGHFLELERQRMGESRQPHAGERRLARDRPVAAAKRMDSSERQNERRCLQWWFLGRRAGVRS
jgi:hypothetical protein